jgi:hypothetical protein
VLLYEIPFINENYILPKLCILLLLRFTKVDDKDTPRMNHIENHWVPWLIYKAKTKEPNTEVQQHRTSLTSVRQRSLKTSKRRTRVGIARLASRLSKFAVARHPSDGAKTKTSKFTLEEHVFLVS